MTEETKMKMMQSILQNAHVGQINMVVESGATINYYEADHKTSMTKGDGDIKAAIEELMNETDDQGGLLFRNKKQWWAVYRVLKDFCNYPAQMQAFALKMKELRGTDVGDKRSITYDSLCAAPKDVPKLASCLPSTWNAYEYLNENYRQQYAVANFLMIKLGIKS